ncbi:MAG TPA: Gfo/Idh/MocA family oxidoreductase [Tepidisphaeraceae bacterium]|nr:Gfo/Idh/MocA family oxidoreductase [Tepidisphaeraceae bacterium]
MSLLSRRALMQSTLAAGASLAAPAAALAQQPEATAPATQGLNDAAASAPKSDKPRLGVIGAGGIARWHGRYLPDHFHIIAVADVDRGRAESFDRDIAGGNAFTTQDYREVLKRDDVEMVLIATPDHWHAKIAVDAMRAGKDVYCEKPLTLTIEEGRTVCRVARETARVVQVGSQQRSEEQFLTAVALAHTGRLGRIRNVIVVIGPTPTKEGEEFEPTALPPQLDWDMWLGQAPLVEYMVKRCHFDFRWWYEYAGGMMTDWGAHHVDIAQWAAAPDEAGPSVIEPVLAKHPVPFDEHGYPTVHNKFNTAREFNVRLTFANGVEMSLVNKHPKVMEENGILFEGERGALFVNRKKIEGSAHETLQSDPLPKGLIPPLPGVPIPHERHVIDFIECCRTRAMPRADVWSHHRNLTTCHLANIALRLNRTLHWNAAAQEIIGDAEATRFLSRPQRKGYEVT